LALESLSSIDPAKILAVKISGEWVNVVDKSFEITRVVLDGSDDTADRERLWDLGFTFWGKGPSKNDWFWGPVSSIQAIRTSGVAFQKEHPAEITQ
jgi:hypothetical protein